MKKAYSKPDIYFEDFSLSTNIAAGCERIPNNNSDITCGVKWSKGVFIFTEGVSGCNRKIVDGADGEYNGLCYHNPDANYNVFMS